MALATCLTDCQADTDDSRLQRCTGDLQPIGCSGRPIPIDWQMLRMRPEFDHPNTVKPPDRLKPSLRLRQDAAYAQWSRSSSPRWPRQSRGIGQCQRWRSKQKAWPPTAPSISRSSRKPGISVPDMKSNSGAFNSTELEKGTVISWPEMPFTGYRHGPLIPKLSALKVANDFEKVFSSIVIETDNTFKSIY